MAKKVTSPWCKEVKKKLIDRDMSSADLADAIGLTREYVSAIVNGRSYSEPATRTISDYLNIQLDGAALAYETSISGKAGGENGERLHE